MRERTVSWVARAEGDTAAPAGGAVVRVDLGALASDLGCSVDDIVRGLRREFSFHEGGAADAAAAAQAAGAARRAVGPAVREALVLATGMPGQDGFPWELLVIGGDSGLTAIEVLLLNLVRAGLTRVVVVLARCGTDIRRAIEAGPVSGRIWVEFVDLGEAFAGTEVDAVLSVRHSFHHDRFVLCAPGRIHRPSLVRCIADFALPNGSAACMLVDQPPQVDGPDAGAGPAGNGSLSAPPQPPQPQPHDIRVWRRRDNPTAVAAVEERGNGFTGSGGAGRAPPGAARQPYVDTGLYLVTPDFLRALTGTWRRPKAQAGSLAAALAALALRRRLVCVAAEGAVWLDLRPEGAAARAARVARAEAAAAAAAGPAREARSSSISIAEEEVGDLEPGVGYALLADDGGPSGGLFPFEEWHGSAPAAAEVAGGGGGAGWQQPAGAAAEAEAGAAQPTGLFRRPRRSLSMSGIGPPKQAARQAAKARGRVFSSEGFLPGMPGAWAPPAGAPAAATGFLLTVPQVASAVGASGRVASSENFRRRERPVFLPAEVELPSDIKQVAIGTVVTEEGTVQVHVEVDKRVPIIGWVLLFTALCGVSMAGPMGRLIDAEAPGLNPMFTALWRQTCSALIYTPFFLGNLLDPEMRRQLRDPSVMRPSITAGLGAASWGLCFYGSLGFTSLANAVLFTHVTPILLVLWKALNGGSITRLEVGGVAVAVVGAAICSTLSHPHSSSNKAPGSDAIGIGLALLAACASGVHLISSKSVRHAVAVSNFVWLAAAVPMTASATFLSVAAGPFMGMQSLFTSRDGLFGWTTSPEMAKLQFATSFFCDVCGSLGFYLVLKYVDPIVVAVTCLLVPVVAVAEGLALGVGAVPNLALAAGGILILSGAAMVMAASMLPHTDVFDGTCAIDGDAAAATATAAAASPPVKAAAAGASRPAAASSGGWAGTRKFFTWGRKAAPLGVQRELRGARTASWEMLVSAGGDGGSSVGNGSVSSAGNGGGSIGGRDATSSTELAAVSGSTGGLRLWSTDSRSYGATEQDPLIK